MAIISALEQPQKRGGFQDLDRTTVFRIFQVVTDDPQDEALKIFNDAPALGLPKKTDKYPTDNDYWCSSLDPRCISDDGRIWEVRVNYTLAPPIQGGAQGDKPWDLDPVVSFGFQVSKEVFEKAYAVNQDISAVVGAVRSDPTFPVQNSVGRDYDPPSMIDEAYLVINIQRNTELVNFDPNTLLFFENTINNDQETIAGIVVPKFNAYLRDYKATKNWTSDNEAYYQETLDVLLNPKTWLKYILDRGIEEKANLGGSAGTASSPGNLVKYKKILDEDGDPVREPVNLNGAGGRAGNKQPYYFEYHGYWETDWSSGLDLPATY